MNRRPGSSHPVPGHVRAFELNGVGVAFRSFDCSMRTKELFGFSYLHALPHAITWREATPQWRHLWFAWGADRYGNGEIGAPYWAFCVAGIVTVTQRSYRRRRRRRRGVCLACGYDLRATPNQCPECGRIPLASELISIGKD